MVAPNRRTRTYRRIYAKTPGGHVVLHYGRRKPGKAQCASCEKFLAGVPHGLPYKVRRLPKTARRPERPFGGNLCGACMRSMMVDRALAKAKTQ